MVTKRSATPLIFMAALLFAVVTIPTSHAIIATHGRPHGPTEINLFEVMDRNNDMLIDFDEFAYYMRKVPSINPNTPDPTVSRSLNPYSDLTHHDIVRIFKKHDQNDDGYITLEEFNGPKYDDIDPHTQNNRGYASNVIGAGNLDGNTSHNNLIVDNTNNHVIIDEDGNRVLVNTPLMRSRLRHENRNSVRR